MSETYQARVQRSTNNRYDQKLIYKNSSVQSSDKSKSPVIIICRYLPVGLGRWRIPLVQGSWNPILMKVVLSINFKGLGNLGVFSRVLTVSYPILITLGEGK